MKVKLEADLLNASIRQAVIDDILNSPEAKARKDEHLRRGEAFRDRTKEHVLRLLRKEMGTETASEMQHRTPNLGIVKKVIGKKARVYKDRPVRKAEDEAGQELLDQAVEVLSMDSLMKQVNALVELHLNIFVMLLPYQSRKDGLWCVAASILDPTRFDVVEDENEPTEPMAVITSYFRDQNGFLQDYRTGDATSSTIAEASASKGKELKQFFVWWSDNFHFTTDEQGVIVQAPDGNVNPFGCIPGVSFAKGQNGQFWAEGGEALVDNAILFGLLMADMNYSAKYQSIGIGYVKGKGPLSSVNVGPSRFIKMAYEEGDPVPEIGFATPSPALDSNMAMLEQFLSMMLTSEGLEPGSITGKLDAGGAATSGVQEIIMRSEPTSIIEDEQQLYKEAEPELVEVLAKIVAAYKPDMLDEDLRELAGMPLDFDYDLSFQAPAPLMTEKERLELFKLKKETGFYSDDELMEYLFPDLDQETRAAKLTEIAARREAMAAALKPVKGALGDKEEKLDDEGKPKDEEAGA
jgi:hypothetical protein